MDSKPTTLPGTSGLKRIQDGDEAASSEEHAAYRKAVGKLQWEIPIRPDVAYSVKELARALAHPLKEDLIKLKTLLRYMKSTSDYRFVLQPDVKLSGTSDQNMDLDVFVDSDWAGCPNTRKSTSGFLILFLGCPIAFGSRTQQTPALSSACLLYTSPSPRDRQKSRMPSSA